jgi:hypothetical protein
VPVHGNTRARTHTDENCDVLLEADGYDDDTLNQCSMNGILSSYPDEVFYEEQSNQ